MTPTRYFDVCLLADRCDRQRLADRIVVVIDILRASTTMITALHNGARAVISCASVDDAITTARKRDDSLLAGERGGTRIDGFDLGNSPREFDAERVTGRTIAFTTTNGTKAIERCLSGGKPIASSIFIGGFVNLSQVFEHVSLAQSVTLMCAGTDGRISREDVLFAGAVGVRLVDAGWQPESDEARIAIDCWRNVEYQIENGSTLASELCNSLGGRNLMNLGFVHDVEFAATIDRSPVLPGYDSEANAITL